MRHSCGAAVTKQEVVKGGDRTLTPQCSARISAVAFSPSRSSGWSGYGRLAEVGRVPYLCGGSQASFSAVKEEQPVVVARGFYTGSNVLSPKLCDATEESLSVPPPRRTVIYLQRPTMSLSPGRAGHTHPGHFSPVTVATCCHQARGGLLLFSPARTKLNGAVSTLTACLATG